MERDRLIEMAAEGSGSPPERHMPSAETALQMSQALRRVREAEGVLMGCDSVQALPHHARAFASAQVRAEAAFDALRHECRLADPARVYREDDAAAVTASG